MAEVATTTVDRTRDSLGRKKSPGRPVTRRPGINSHYSPEIGKLICKGLANSLPFAIACQSIGVSAATATGWNDKGIDDPDGPYGRFARNVDKARGIAVAKRLKRITLAAQGGTVLKKVVTDPEGGTTVTETEQPANWQADKWVLEVTEREHFGPRQTIDSTNRTETISLNVSANLSVSALGTLQALLAKLKSGNESNPAKTGLQTIVVESSGQGSGKALPSTLNRLDAATETIGNLSVDQSLGPQGGNLTIPTGQPGE